MTTVSARMFVDVRSWIVVGSLVLGGCVSQLRPEHEPAQAAVPVGDRDGDHLAGEDDHCADAAEDFDGFQDDDGCPDPDDDQDGIPDARDLCRCVAEDFDGYQDDDGCPDEDNDGDGILDACDACPNEPEIRDGCADQDGCPDRARIEIERQHIVIVEHVVFARGSSVIDARSHPLLEAIVAALEGNPQITRIRATGHADFGEPRPDRLSAARARAVRDWLVARGIDAARIDAEGAADAAPRVPRDGAAGGREANRRVELEVIEIDGRAVDADTGAPRFAPRHASCETGWRSPCEGQPPPRPRNVCE